jgi:nucleoid-associated protein YgaU
MKTLTFAVLVLALAPWAGAQQVTLLEDEAKGGVKAAAVADDGMPQVIAPKEGEPAAAVPAAPAPQVQKPVKKIINKKKKSAAPAAAKPAAPSAFPFEPVKPEEMPAAEVKPVPAVKPVEAVKPAAAVAAPKAAAPAATVKPAVIVPAKPAVQPAPAVAGTGFSVNKTHTVTGGDTLWDLSKKYYKDPYRWGKIYNANLGTVKNPDRIYPSEELVIPDMTEEVKPAAAKAQAMTGAETVKEAEFSSSDVTQPAEAPAPAAVPVKTAQAELGDMLKEFDANDLSEEMPEHQKEWSAGVIIVPDSWREDGVVSAAEKGEDEQMTNSLSISGDVILLSMEKQVLLKKGDRLAVYMKGAAAFDKAGKKLGREIQRAGTLQVISSEGRQVRATVIDALTAITKGYVVKKK